MIIYSVTHTRTNQSPCIAGSPSVASWPERFHIPQYSAPYDPPSVRSDRSRAPGSDPSRPRRPSCSCTPAASPWSSTCTARRSGKCVQPGCKEQSQSCLRTSKPGRELDNVGMSSEYGMGSANLEAEFKLFSSPDLHPLVIEA